MRLIGGFIFHVFANLVALYAAAELVPGFTFAGDFAALLGAAVVLTAINLILRPILKLFFGPFIVLTFGLFAILINAVTLYILDIVILPLTIQGYVPLLSGTLIVGAVNLLVGFGARTLYRK